MESLNNMGHIRELIDNWNSHDNLGAIDLMGFRELARPNDLPIKTFIVIALAIMMVTMGSWVLASMGLALPGIQIVFGFIFLALIPGYSILRILRVHNIGVAKGLMYSIALSLGSIMLLGLFLNTILFALGIDRPLSSQFIFGGTSFLTIILCVMANLRDKEFKPIVHVPNNINYRFVPISSLILLPILAALASVCSVAYKTDLPLMVILVPILIVPILVAFGKLRKEYYLVSIFCIALALLLRNALATYGIWGWDIQLEKYLANEVINNAFWNSAIPIATNGMLSIVVLVPIFSVVLGLSVETVLRIIVPCLLALVPVSLFLVFRTQVDERLAFFSCFFFISIFIFFTEMLQLGRQEIAEFFLGVLILVLLDKELHLFARYFLAISLIFSLVVSHYGLSYIFALIIVISLIANAIMQSKMLRNTLTNMGQKIRNYGGSLGEQRENVMEPEYLEEKPFFTSGLATLFFVMFIGWYIYVSSSSTFDSIILIINRIANNIGSDLLDPSAAQGLALITASSGSILHEITKYLDFVSQFFIVIGFLAVGIGVIFKFSRQFILFCLSSLMILGASIIIPFFASSLNTTRIYQISLIFLAPLCIVGMFFVVKYISVKMRKPKAMKPLFDVLVSLFLVLFLALNSGAIYFFIEGQSNVISNNSSSEMPALNYQESVGSEWLMATAHPSQKILADDDMYYPLSGNQWGRITFLGNESDMPKNSLIFLSNINVESGLVLIRNYTTNNFHFNIITNYTYNIVYNNGENNIGQTY